MLLRESVIDATQITQDSKTSSRTTSPRTHRGSRAARRRSRPVVQRPTGATPRSFSLSIIPLAST